MSPMLTIARREFRAYFDSPLAYVVICLAFAGLGLTFFNLGVRDFWAADRATLEQLYAYVPVGLCAAVVPVVTMALLAEERRSGTLEMLITLPVRDSDVVLGKYAGALGLVLTLVFSTALYPLSMFKFPWNLGALDWGPIASAYCGLLLFSAAAVSIGLLVSSLAPSQAIAFFVTFAILVVLWFLGDLAVFTGGTLGIVLNYLSFQSHMEGFVRGLIDLRDIIFFLSITAVCLAVAFRALERRKWA
jgi:ABC-2 type transport system permease protein